MAAVKSDRRIDVPINIVLHVRESDVPYLNQLAIERGCGYGDPGRIELIRRLLIDGGTEGFEKLNEDGEGIRYTIS